MKSRSKAIVSVAVACLVVLSSQTAVASEISGKKPKPKPKPKPQTVASLTVTLTQQMLYSLNMPMGSTPPPATDATARLSTKCNSRTGREVTVVSAGQVIATGQSTMPTPPNATLHDQTRDKWLQMDFYTGDCVTGASFANIPKKPFYEVRVGGVYAGTWSYETIASQNFVVPLKVSGVLSCAVDMTDNENTCG